MKNTPHFLRIIVLGMLALNLGAGCSSKGVNENDPKSMFEDAEQDISNDRYLLALDKLRVVKSKFSYSSYGALAQLRMGDVYFLQESYPEAAASYETFVELYPKHEKSGYAQYKAGESYFMDIPSTIARDMKSAENAVQAYTTYLKHFPTGEFAASATDHKTQAFNKLSEKELDIAKFYMRRKKYDSARTRLQKIIDQFSGTPASTKAMETLKEIPNTTSSPQ